eukprot:TRINITY_DN10427_c0_g1_i11.p2 TRINITY_DN10427_c0_g1~~TRINITY_DN10427_c0_g1_i11.p2  ORF type:complete len:103 (+),score=15.67 TRINITY_DN10427_c0_g1_i11:215-523(+)
MQVYSLEDMISLTSCRRAFSASWVQAPQTFYSQCKGKLVLTTQQMQVYSLEDVISLPSFRRACKGKLVLTTEQIQVNAPEDVISLTSAVGRRSILSAKANLC